MRCLRRVRNIPGRGAAKIDEHEEPPPFPTSALGIRLGLSRWDGEETLDERYELATTWFFKRRLGARIVLARTRTDLPVTTVQDVDDVTLQLIGRL